MMPQVLFLIAYMLLFLFSGLLHVILYGVPFTDSIMLILYGGIAFLWGISVSRRIMDPRIRRLILSIISLIELFSCFRSATISFFRKAFS